MMRGKNYATDLQILAYSQTTAYSWTSVFLEASVGLYLTFANEGTTE